MSVYDNALHIFYYENNTGTSTLLGSGSTEDN